MRKNKNENELRTHKEEKRLSHLGECAILTQGTKEYSRNVAPPSIIELHQV